MTDDVARRWLASMLDAAMIGAVERVASSDSPAVEATQAWLIFARFLDQLGVTDVHVGATLDGEIVTVPLALLARHAEQSRQAEEAERAPESGSTWQYEKRRNDG